MEHGLGFGIGSKSRGFRTLALTDINNLYGCVKFWETAHKAGVRPILGADIRHASGSALLLVESKAGYARLCELLTAVHQDETFNTARELVQDPGGLIVLSADENLLASLKGRIPPDHLFGMITSLHYHWLLRRLRAEGIEAAVCPEVAFIDPSEHAVHRILRAISLNTTLSRLCETDIASPTAWLKPAASVLKEFAHLPEALENTVRIAERCLLDSPPWGETVFPSYEGLSPEEAQVELERMCWEAIDGRYGGRPPDVVARLRRELEIIREKGFASYFIVVRDIVKQATQGPHNDSVRRPWSGAEGATRICGRGSGAASLVSHLLGITAVDPIRHNLLFERFLNPSRKDPPDIDVDFAWDERDDILSYVFEKYGLKHSAMVANHVTFQPRMAVREVAKAYGLPDDEIGRVTERLDHYFQSEGLPSQAIRGNAFRDLDFKEPWPEILKIADRIIGLPRHLSVHPGGIVLTPGPIRRHVPVQFAAKTLQDNGQRVPIIHWEKDQAEDAGLVKIDLLGNRSLAVIRDAVRSVKEHSGKDINFVRTNPIDDPATQELIRTGRTMGCFYVESPAMRLLLKRSQKGDFDHLVIASSIIRPAANDYIMEYIARVRGEKPAEPIHPLLEPVLADSYQIAVYQEHVMLIATAMAGFTISEADGLRKALGKKDFFVRLGQFKERFFAGAKAKGVSDEKVAEVWRMIESFNGYSFCKPHSASYALVSYQATYLKAHHPAEFFAAVISNQGGYYSWWAYHNEAVRSGLKVLPPNVNLSRWEWIGRENTLRMGFMQIRGLKKEAAETVLDDRRRGGPYGSIREFLDRVRVDPADTIRLIKAGAFDNVSVNLTRAQMVWSVLKNTAARPGRNGSLFEHPQRIPVLDHYDEETLLRYEIEVLGFLVSRHPLTLYRDEIERLGAVPAADLHRHVGRRITLVGWWVTDKMAETKHGERMEFVSFEDTTALFDATLFPKVYARAVSFLRHSTPYVIRGKVEEQFGACTVTLSQLSPVQSLKGTDPRSISMASRGRCQPAAANFP